MKVGDMVDHRNGGPKSVLGTGLITGLVSSPITRLDQVEVLWSNTGELGDHYASELRVLHECE